MSGVCDFEEVRADGKIIPATMTLEQLLASGWGPCKVVALRWSHDGSRIEFHVRGSVLAAVVPGENFVAALLSDQTTGPPDRLVVLSPDGTEYRSVAHCIRFMGAERDGRWVGLELPANARSNVFGAIFQSPCDGDFLCDIDASTAQVVAVRRTR
jgi:hypothetical protein